MKLCFEEMYTHALMCQSLDMVVLCVNKQTFFSPFRNIFLVTCNLNVDYIFFHINPVSFSSEQSFLSIVLCSRLSSLYLTPSHSAAGSNLKFCFHFNITTHLWIEFITKTFFWIENIIQKLNFITKVKNQLIVTNYAFSTMLVKVFSWKEKKLLTLKGWKREEISWA